MELFKEIQEKYDRAKMIVKQLNKDYEFEQTLSSSYINELEKELKSIDDFFRHLTDN